MPLACGHSQQAGLDEDPKSPPKERSMDRFFQCQNGFLIQIAIKSDQSYSLLVVLRRVINRLGIMAIFVGPVEGPNLDLSRYRNKKFGESPAFFLAGEC